jgi:carboxypeptidase Q
MSRRVVFLIAALTLVTTAQAADRGPSTPEERARVVQLAAASDGDPLKAMAADGRWFEKWLDEVPDLSFGPEAPARWMEANAKGDLRRVAVFKYQVGAIAYMIQHQIADPRKAPDQLVAVHTAALEGVVRAYRVLRDTKPENRSPKFDEALEKLDKGEFPAFVKSLFGAAR